MDLGSINVKNRFYYLESGKRLYLFLGVFFLLCYIFIDPTIEGPFREFVGIFLLIFVIALTIWGVYLHLKGSLNFEAAVFLLMIIGVSIRLAYVLYTGWWDRQHDIRDGHYDYILHFFNSFSLPDTNFYQYAHPPLHHFISGMFMRISALFHLTESRMLEGIQLMTTFYSCCVMVISYRIFKALKLSGVFLFIPTSIICFHPIFIMLGGSINNDMLMLLFMFSTILWLIRWYENANFYNTCFLALCLGLAMMSKMSAAMLAFIIAPVFLMKLISFKKPFIEWKLFTKFLVFGAISIPLGMWYPIRNLIKFGQKFGHVFLMDPNSPLYCGDQSVIGRFLQVSIPQLFSNVYVNILDDYNFEAFVLKSSIFGEYTFQESLVSFAEILLLMNIILVVFSLIAMIYIMFAEKRPEKRFGKIILFALWITQMASFIYFNIQYPFACSMDFRYIVPTLLCGAGFMGMAMEHIALTRQTLWKHISKPVYICVVGFCLFSSLFYLFAQ